MNPAAVGMVVTGMLVVVVASTVVVAVDVVVVIDWHQCQYT